MSDAHEPQPDGPRRPGPVAIIVLAVIALLVVAVFAMVLADREGEPDPDPTPTAPSTPFDTPEPTPDDPDDDEPLDPDEERDPTDADAAEFSTGYEPPGGRDVETVTVDVNADGRNEVVVVSIAADLVRLDVAGWTGREYEIVFTDQGGRADEITDFTVVDLTGDGTREIITIQTSGEEGESLSLWGWSEDAFVRQSAEGGCWDGSHTYGIIGVEIVESEEAGTPTPEIHATCDDSPLPPVAWTTDVYAWDGEAWRYDRTETP